MHRKTLTVVVPLAMLVGLPAFAEEVQLTCSSPLLPAQQYYLLDTEAMTSKRLSGNEFVIGTLTTTESVYRIDLPRHRSGAPMQLFINRYTGKGQAEWGVEPLGGRSPDNIRSTVTCTKTEQEPKI